MIVNFLAKVRLSANILFSRCRHHILQVIRWDASIRWKRLWARRCSRQLTSENASLPRKMEAKIKSSDGEHLADRLFPAQALTAAISELNKVYTNGTLVDDALLIDEQAGHCISIREGKPKDSDDDGGAETTNMFGICVLDSATSEFSLSSFEDDIFRTKLETLLRQLRPKEVVYMKVSVLS